MIRGFLIITIFATSAFAETPRDELALSNHLSSLLRTTLTEKIAGADIRVPSLQKLIAQKPMSNFTEFKTARLVSDRSNGIAVFEIGGLNGENQEITETIQTPYEAWKKVPVAAHRIYPNSKLKNEDFKTLEVNVATGLPREFRGVMIPGDTNFSHLESKQTILEGQYVVSSAIQKQPDVRKGDTVKLELVSGDLSLTTQGIAEEEASIGGQIRVMTTKTKREITGHVKEDRSVEVTL